MGLRGVVVRRRPGRRRTNHPTPARHRRRGRSTSPCSAPWHRHGDHRTAASAVAAGARLRIDAHVGQSTHSRPRARALAARASRRPYRCSCLFVPDERSSHAIDVFWVLLKNRRQRDFFRPSSAIVRSVCVIIGVWKGVNRPFFSAHLRHV